MKTIRLLLPAWIILAGAAHAHQPWVLTEPGTVETGASAQVTVYFGHAFPGDTLIDPERIAGIAVAAPSGTIEALEVDSAVPFESPVLNDPGIYAIGIEQARGFWSKTPDGGRPQPRSALDNAVTCNYSGNAAKTLIRVGDADASGAGVPIGHRLEIVAEGDPTRMGAGDALAVQVRFEGKAHPGPVQAFHAGSGEEPYRTVEADANGRAEIELSGSGPWMLVAYAELPYPDPAVCDTEGFYASLTFHGRE
jgi:uncharacterized GH25 family protein